MKMTALWRRMVPIGVMLVVLVVAAGLRFHNLGAQSLWYDEGVAYGHSQRTLAELIPALQNNVHVPAYFGLLALYEDFVGASEFGLRSLSAFFSVLSVALTYALGKRLFGPIAGITAAVFVALNTFSIYYAQEARMYAMLTAIAAASMWVFVGFFLRLMPATAVSQSNAKRLAVWVLALGLLNTIGSYTHYSYALVMLAQGVLASVWLLAQAYDSLYKPPDGVRRPGLVLRALAAYVLANLLTIALFLPWLPTALQQVGAQPNISDAMPLPDLLSLLFGWLAVGRTYAEALGGMGVVVYFFLLFGLLVLPDDRKRAWWATLVPVVWVLVALGLYLYLELYARYLRFLLPAQIGLALWLGRGVWVLWRVQTRQRQMRAVPKVAAVLSALAFAVTLARGIPALYTDAAHLRDDYRGLAQSIAAEAGANDAVVLSAPGLAEVFGYYYRGEAPVYPLPAATDPVADTLGIIDQAERVFAVYYGTAEQDPDEQVRNTLNRHAYPISNVWVDDLRFVRYVTPAAFGALQPADVRFGDHITLQAYGLHTNMLEPGAALQIRLEWRTDAPLTTRYKVFVQLLNRAGRLVAQRDSEPADGLAPTTGWQPGITQVDNHALVIPDLPAGAYTLIVGLYVADEPMSRLVLADGGDYLALGALQIVDDCRLHNC